MPNEGYRRVAKLVDDRNKEYHQKRLETVHAIASYLVILLDNFDTVKVPEVDRCMQSSINATRQPRKVELSAIGKNMCRLYNKTDSIEIGSPETDMEKALKHRMIVASRRFLGATTKQYPDRNADMCDPRYVAADALNNIPSNLRQQVPGQAAQVAEAMRRYSTIPEETFRLESILEDPALGKAINFLLDYLPDVKADPDITDAAAPFEKKWTGAGYPCGKNAKSNFADDDLQIMQKVFPEIDNWDTLPRDENGECNIATAYMHVAAWIVNHD